MKARFGKAAGAVNKFSRIWTNKTFSTRVKLHLYNSIIVPIVLYGAETWPMTETLEKRTDGFVLRSLRRILISSGKTRIRTAAIREETGQCPISILYYRNDGSLGLASAT